MRRVLLLGIFALLCYSQLGCEPPKSTAVGTRPTNLRSRAPADGAGIGGKQTDPSKDTGE
jgi:hypothetical protein